MKHPIAIPLAALALATVCCANAGAFERNPFDRSRFAQTEAAGKQAVAAAATEAPASATAAPAAAKPNPAFVELFGKSLLTDKGKKADLTELTGKQTVLTLAKTPADITGGVILRGEIYDIDLSSESVVAEMFANNEKAISDKLFGEGARA